MNKKALVIGIDEYKNLTKLNGCVNDAKKISERLSSQEYGFDVELLINEEVTRKTLKAAIGTILTNSDFSFIYFAGHGIKTNISTYLATQDSEWDDEGIEFSFVIEAITKLARNDQTVLLVLDCCHSGVVLEKADQKFSPITISDIPSPTGTGKIVIAACQAEQTAKECTTNNTSHGLFTSHLIDALNGYSSDKDSKVTAIAAYEYVAAQLSKAGNQKPMLRGDISGRIVLGEGITPIGPFSMEPPKTPLDEIITEANKHVENYFESIQKIGLKDYETNGHREACARLSPIIEWFERRISENKTILKNNEFKKAWTNTIQQYQLLSNVTQGIILDKSREIGEFIGSGTFGSVWKIVTPEGANICYKAYHATELRDREKIGRFSRGYKAMAQLDHPSIISVHESTTVPLGFYMRYIDGPNLRQYNPATSCEIEQTLELLLDVGETLAHAHGRNVLHRDVKPENILIDIQESGELNPFLTDFDLAWFSTATKLTKLAGDGFGSHFYAAPEQMNSPASNAAHQPSVDAYSFGQVMFFSICGRDPAILNQKENIKILEDHLAKISISERTASLVTTIYKECTSINPSVRLADFRKICDAIGTALTYCRVTEDLIPTGQFLQELRFLISGKISKNSDPKPHGSVTMESLSKRTNIIISIKKENDHNLAIEVTFIPFDDLAVNGAANAATSRQIVNERIDTALSNYTHKNSAKRTAVKGSAYQTIVNFEGITKNALGLIRSREIIMAVINSVERN